MKTYGQIIILLLFTSFGSTNIPIDKPQLIRLKISECIEDSEKSDKIISESYTAYVYKINFGMLLNCSGQDSLSVKLKGDTLKIRVLSTRKSQRPEIESNGDTTWITPYASCICYYKIAAEIKNLTGQPKVISVNKKILEKS